MKVATINCRGLGSPCKRVKLNHLLQKEAMSIAICTEIKTHINVLSPSWECISSCTQGRGGATIIIRHKHGLHICGVMASAEHAIAAKVLLHNEPILVIGVYVPCSGEGSAVIEELHSLLATLDIPQRVVLAGDLNHHEASSGWRHMQHAACSPGNHPGACNILRTGAAISAGPSLPLKGMDPWRALTHPMELH